MSAKLPLRLKPRRGDCPYCLRPVGILGNWIAILFGTGFHGCDFSNVRWEVIPTPPARTEGAEP